MKLLAKLAGICIVATPGWTAPQIAAILNAASYAQPGMPNSAIAQGSMFVVFGTGMGPADIVQAGVYPLPTTLSGTSVRVTVGATAVDAFLVYAHVNQIAAVLPSGTPTGIGLLSVTYNGHTSEPGAFRIVRNSPGILTQNQAGTGPALAQNFNSESDQPRNTLTHAAHAGQVLTLWATGLGPISGSDAAQPVPGDLNLNLQLLVGGKPAKVRYKGRSGCCAGIDQVQFELPANVDGCSVPVAIRVDDAVSNFGTIAVAASGDVCTDLSGASGADLERWQAGANVAAAAIGLHVTQDCEDFYPCGFDTPVPFIESGEASFLRSGLSLIRTRAGLPPAGSCIVSPAGVGSGALVGAPQPLDAGGVLNVSGPKGARQIMLQSPGYFSQQFAQGATVQFLVPGTYVIDNGAGGADVGPFQVMLTVPPTFTSTVDSLGAHVTWTGGDPAGFVTIQGGSASPTTRAAAAVVCTERVSAGQFTVPPEVLLSLPAAPSLSASYQSTAMFRARGLDLGQVTFGQ
ncbi:MAG TPA: hypothetical protein VMH28_26330 [Candidatus Acidoferrales bacterium]|nr:hypothetical protein [Candidatus Acidoferrales bacterium]